MNEEIIKTKEYEEQPTTETVNGQDGSVSGRIPVSPGKVATLVLGGLAILGALYYFLLR